MSDQQTSRTKHARSVKLYAEMDGRMALSQINSPVLLLCVFFGASGGRPRNLRTTITRIWTALRWLWSLDFSCGFGVGPSEEQVNSEDDKGGICT